MTDVKRHILKTISYRILGSSISMASAYYFVGSIEIASVIGVGELLLKPLVYFIHERVWFKYVKINVPTTSSGNNNYEKSSKDKEGSQKSEA